MTTGLREGPGHRRAARAPHHVPLRVALVGNPNCGKSTLFNALTGMRQQVANFPGVTVERVEGNYISSGGRVSVLDLPGIYALEGQSPDESIAIDQLLGRGPGAPPIDVIVLVLDAERLDRSLYLATLVLELGLPTVVALNRMDRAVAAGVKIDVPELIHELGAVVVPLVAATGEGVEHLRRVIDLAPGLQRPDRVFIDFTLDDEESDILQSDEALRHTAIASLLDRTVERPAESHASLSDRVDGIVLHRWWGPLVFLAVMLLVFQGMFTWARPIADGIQLAINALASWVAAVLPRGDLRDLVTNGILGGVGSVLVFLPQIALLFLCIGVLEDCGYLARAAFAMDRFMRPLGLQGRSFVPLISGHACAVPAIMSARTIQHPRERLATIFVTPLVSCSARLPVYALLIAAFVPVAHVGPFSVQGLTLLGMYALGLAAALGSAALLRHSLLRSDTRALILELPPYAVPNARVLAASVWRRVRVFLRRAGTVIFALSIVLWAMATYPRASAPAGHPITAEQQLSHSALGRVGHAIEPAVRPLGFDWKIGVSMVASFAAREVFVSTMSTIYGVEGAGTSRSAALAQRLRSERSSGGTPTYGLLVGLGLMAFYAFALMCTSTVTMSARESAPGWRGIGWAALQFAYMLLLAYGAAFAVRHAGLAMGLGG